LDKQVDICFGGWVFTATRVKFFDFTAVYFESSIHFAVPPGRDLTSIEKLIYPFELTATVFTVGVFIIFIIKLRSKTVQNFVFGKKVNSPYLNMLIGFIGGSQNVLPTFNFSRDFF
jgi:hypothetical protein